MTLTIDFSLHSKMCPHRTSAVWTEGTTEIIAINNIGKKITEGHSYPFETAIIMQFNIIAKKQLLVNPFLQKNKIFFKRGIFCQKGVSLPKNIKKFLSFFQKGLAL
ncbi:MAG: hypothetical protein J6U87_05970 [Clostridia bacterium]|nr:hypothetical protein [Clostridia bacterium]